MFRWKFIESEPASKVPASKTQILGCAIPLVRGCRFQAELASIVSMIALSHLLLRSKRSCTSSTVAIPLAICRRDFSKVSLWLCKLAAMILQATIVGSHLHLELVSHSPHQCFEVFRISLWAYRSGRTMRFRSFSCQSKDGDGQVQILCTC